MHGATYGTLHYEHEVPATAPAVAKMQTNAVKKTVASQHWYVLWTLHCRGLATTTH